MKMPDVKKGAIECLVTAKNLPEPVVHILKIQVGYSSGNILEKATMLLNSGKVK